MFINNRFSSFKSFSMGVRKTQSSSTPLFSAKALAAHASHTRQLLNSGLAPQTPPQNITHSGVDSWRDGPNALFLGEVKRIQISFTGFISRTTQESVLEKKTAVSGNEDVLQINSFDGDAFEDFTVRVHQLATGQTNAGRMLNVNANPGTQKNSEFRFEVEVDGKTHELSFTAQHNETNTSFQQLMADAINEAGIGVDATVVFSDDGRRSGINIEGSDAGTEFTLRDVQGNAVALTGANTVAQGAQEAVFSINGGEAQTSQTNNVDLGNGITATLRSVSDEDVTVSMNVDTKAVVSEINKFVGSFNKIVWHASATQAHSTTLVASMHMTVAASMTMLSTIGINCTDGGYLEVDEEKAHEAAQNGTTHRFFNNWAEGRGFLERLLQLFNSFARNPWQFMNESFDRVPPLIDLES